MSHPENAPEHRPDPDDGAATPLQGQVRHSQLSARVPEDVGTGVFSNGVMILTGAFEVVLDFVLRLGEPQRIVARVVLAHVVARQFAAALQENLGGYEQRFGPLPRLPRARPLPGEPGAPVPPGDEAAREAAAGGVPMHPENAPQTPPTPHIEDIYHELRLPDAMLSGRYANAVLIRHSGVEFCFDFITNIFPRSCVSTRVYLAAAHVGPMLQSLIRSLSPPDPPPPSAI